jgi:hypothetical protein
MHHPCTLKLKRKESFTVTIHKPGYRKVTTQVISQVAGAGAAGMAGNVIVGGIIGVGVDAATGATKELKPNPLEVVLEVEESASRGSRPRPPWQRGGRGQAQRGVRDRPDRRPATIRRDRKGRRQAFREEDFHEAGLLYRDLTHIVPTAIRNYVEAARARVRLADTPTVADLEEGIAILTEGLSASHHRMHEGDPAR